MFALSMVYCAKFFGRKPVYINEMERWQGKVAIVTGTSSEVGTAIVQRLVKAGLTVVGLVRREDRKEEIPKELKEKFYQLIIDVTKKEDINAAYRWVKKYLGFVHVLINNIEVTGRDDNFPGWSMVTRETVKLMKEANVSVPISVTHLYAASKHVVTVLTEIVIQEPISFGEIQTSPSEFSPQVFQSFEDLHETEEEYLKVENVVNGVLFILSIPPSITCGFSNR